MISNCWEELGSNINKNINQIHEKILSEMQIPEWMNLDCPFCKKKLPLSSIREFGVKLNPRNVCDLFVLICCNDCKKMDTLYFRDEIVKITDFIDFLNGIKTPKSIPVIEEEMYNLKYNNTVEKIHYKMLEIKKE